jgi:hypothetical protein
MVGSEAAQGGVLVAARVSDWRHGNGLSYAMSESVTGMRRICAPTERVVMAEAFTAELTIMIPSQSQIPITNATATVIHGGETVRCKTRAEFAEAMHEFMYRRSPESTLF